jgi:probable phosphoglycerate mutase
MLTLYLVRHGQTAASSSNRFCGRLDEPLTPAGHAMAEALGAAYGNAGFAEIVSSSLLRARDTAAPAARRAGLPVNVDDGFIEIAYGEWDGRAEDEVEKNDPARFAAWAAHPGSVPPPGGETGAEIAVRALAALERVRARHQDGKVLVVSHKATIRVLLCALLGMDVDHFRRRIGQKVCAVNVLSFPSTGPLLSVLGDVSHLGPELRNLEGT